MRAAPFSHHPRTKILTAHEIDRALNSSPERLTDFDGNTNVRRMECSTMSKTLSLAALALGAGLLITTSTVQAAPISAPQTPLVAGKSLLEPVQYGGRCRAWRRTCAYRWGWGGPRFRRCMRNHGCW